MMTKQQQDQHDYCVSQGIKRRFTEATTSSRSVSPRRERTAALRKKGQQAK